MCVLTLFPREVAFILCPFTGATWWDEMWKGHYSLQQQRDREPLQHTGGTERERERLSVSACELRGERWPLTLTKGTEMERGQACVHLPFIILALSTELNLENGDTQPATPLNMDVLDVNVDLKWCKGCHVSTWDWSGRRLIRQEMFYGRKWSKYVRLHREL